MSGDVVGWPLAAEQPHGRSTEEKIMDVRVVHMGDASLDRTANYLAKITSEITSPSTKEGRDGNRAPFAILRDALATGLAEDCELWLTWEKVSHNKRQLTWSRGLREWAGLHVEHTDEEIAQQDMHGDDQLIIPSECWPAVRTELAELLDTAESGGAAAARRWLESRGLHWIAVARTHSAMLCPPNVKVLDTCQGLATLTAL
jgi:hypothetical protein